MILKDKKTAPYQKPDSVAGINVCRASGLLPPDTGGCETKYEYFLRDSIPKRRDPGKQAVWIDKGTNDLPSEGQTENLESREEYVIEDATGDKYCVSCPHPTPEPAPQP